MSQRLRNLERVLLFVAGAGAVLLAFWWYAEAPRREMEALPAAERAVLYGRTLENLRLCRRQGPDRPERFCEDQATLVLTFPECDQECLRLSRPFLPQPRR